MQIAPLELTPVSMSARSHLGETQPAVESKSFGEFLADSIKEVSSLQHKSEEMSALLAAGELDDISQAVIASEKADIALQLTMQVRNRIVEAYQEMMRMQV